MHSMTPKRDKSGYRKITQKDAHLIATRHEMLYAGRMGGARASFAFCDLSGLDLSGRALNDADFSGAILTDVNFERTKLENAIFFAADLRRANLKSAAMRRADLRGASMRGANLTGADLFECDLREGVIAQRDRNGGFKMLRHNETPADMPGAILANANLERSKMSGVIALQADFSDAIMRGIRLTRANLRRANLQGAILENADLSGADLSGANLSGAVLTGATIGLARTDGADMTGVITEAPCGIAPADLSESIYTMLRRHGEWVESGGASGKPASLANVDLRTVSGLAAYDLTALLAPKATLYGAFLEGVRLQGAQLGGADLRGAKLRGADLRGINLKDARLSGADLRDANLGPLIIAGERLMPAQLGKADLRNADLRGTDLNHAGLAQADASFANFTGANLRKTDLSGAALEGAVIPRDQLRETLIDADARLAVANR